MTTLATNMRQGNVTPINTKHFTLQLRMWHSEFVIIPFANLSAGWCLVLVLATIRKQKERDKQSRKHQNRKSQKKCAHDTSTVFAIARVDSFAKSRLMKIPAAILAVSKEGKTPNNERPKSPVYLTSYWSLFIG
jgi:hypothetical protein